jgi:hypothetical protein
MIVPDLIKAVEEGMRKHNMITAKEAKELYDQSGHEVADYLKYTVEKEVVKAAEGGKRNTVIHLGSKGPYEYLVQVITPLQQAVVEKLKELGYRAEIKLYGESYVPRGLADDDGNGPSHENYGIHISW